MTKKQIENQIKEDFWNRYRTFTGRLATALSQVDPNNLLIAKTIIWTSLNDLQEMTKNYKDILGDIWYEKIHNVKWKFPKDHSDIQQMINELGLIID